MKNYYLLPLFLFYALVSCSQDEPDSEFDFQTDEWIEYDSEPIRISDKMMSLKGKDLSILFIGNSFGIDVSHYLPNILEANDIHNVTIGRLHLGGSCLEQHIDGIYNNESIYETYFISKENAWKSKEVRILSEVLKQEKWDIIILQQNSCFYINWNNLIQKSQELEYNINNCLGYKPCYVWLSSWAYADGMDIPNFNNYNNSEKTMYNCIISRIYNYIQPSGLYEVIIPTYSLVQNIRNTYLCNPPFKFTRDGYHADLGATRALLAYLFFDIVIAPLEGINSGDIKYFDTTEGNIPFNSESRKVLLPCIQNAIEYPYKIN